MTLSKIVEKLEVLGNSSSITLYVEREPTKGKKRVSGELRFIDSETKRVKTKKVRYSSLMLDRSETSKGDYDIGVLVNHIYYYYKLDNGRYINLYIPREFK